MIRRNRPCGERCVGLEGRLMGIPEDSVEVVPGPQMVVSEPVDAARGVELSGPVGGLTPEHDPEL
jgi:hypothetical protein